MSVFKVITEKLQGRHTAALLAFFISGNVFHYFHRLDSTYITFMTVFMGYVLGHSVKEDIFAGKTGEHHDEEK